MILYISNTFVPSNSFRFTAGINEHIGYLNREVEELKKTNKWLEEKMKTVAAKHDNRWIEATLDMAK